MIPQENIDKALLRYDYLTNCLAQPDATANIEVYRKNTRELAELQTIIDLYRSYNNAVDNINVDKELLKIEVDLDLRKLYMDEIVELTAQSEQLAKQLTLLLLPKDPADSKDVIVEIRAGVGGDEAALFAHELFCMYMKWAEKNNWTVNIASDSVGKVCGLKEVVFSISGKDVYSKMKYESGVHRVQRVPETEANGRIHTSTATVAVLPERDEVEVKIDPKDIRIDLFHSSGAGGQNVNKVETAIRITHFPTGIVVACQDERSQLKNKERAFAILRSKLFDYYNSKSVNEEVNNRRDQVGNGDRNEKIRTYNFPQHRLTDHRINFTSYDLPKYLNGNLSDLVEQLQLNSTLE